MRCAFSFALLKAGRSIAARMAIMAMTTNNSIKVNPRRRAGLFVEGLKWMFMDEGLLTLYFTRKRGIRQLHECAG